MRILFSFGISLWALSLPYSAHADGPERRLDDGQWGLNRRVKLLPGVKVKEKVNAQLTQDNTPQTKLVQKIYGIRTTFSGLDSVRIPMSVAPQSGPNAPLAFVQINNISNTFTSKPTAYLGFSFRGGADEVDAGFQFESPHYIFSVDRGVPLTLVSAGHSLFISWQKAYTLAWEESPQFNGLYFPFRAQEDSYHTNLQVWDGQRQVRTGITPAKGAVSVEIQSLDGTFRRVLFVQNLVRPGTENSNTRYERLPWKKDMPFPPKLTPTLPRPQTYPAQPSALTPIKGVEVTSTLPSDIPIVKSDQRTGIANQIMSISPLQNYTDSLGNLSLKKVVGVTLASGVTTETEGTYFSCSSKDTRIIYSQQNNNEATTQVTRDLVDPGGASGQNDSGGEDNRKGTGYDTHQNEKDLEWGDLDFPISDRKFKINFIGITNANSRAREESGPNNAKSAFETTTEEDTDLRKSRYTEETVEFNLRNAARVWGYSIQPRSVDMTYTHPPKK